MPGKEVRGLFQALTEGGWGGLIGPTGIYMLHGLEIHTCWQIHYCISTTLRGQDKFKTF